MEDWENDDFEPAHPALKKEPLKSKWDDEDAEEDDVKDSWEDEDAAEAPKPVPPAVKSASKTDGRTSDKKSKKAEAKQTDAKENVVDCEVLTDPVAEKLRQQRIVEESDYKTTQELFGKRSDEKSLDNFIPKSENDFLEYAELISYKLRPYEVLMLKRSLLLQLPLQMKRLRQKKRPMQARRNKVQRKNSFTSTSQMLMLLLVAMKLWMIMISCDHHFLPETFSSIALIRPI